MSQGIKEKERGRCKGEKGKKMTRKKYRKERKKARENI